MAKKTQKNGDSPQKWQNDKLGFITKTNADLVCVDCVFKMHKPGFCEKFPLPGRKPRSVLMGGECNEYKKE